MFVFYSCLSRIIGIILWLCVSTSSVAFSSTVIPSINVSDIHTFRNILPQTALYIDKANQTGFVDAPVAAYRINSSESSTWTVTTAQLTLPHYLRFAVYNDLPDTAFLYFYADLQEYIQVREERNGQLAFLPEQAYEGRIAMGTRTFLLVIPPQQTVQYVTKIIPFKSRFSEISPALVQASYIAQLFKEDYQNSSLEMLQFTVFCGMLFMMLLYISFKFVQVKSKEYFYYAGYIFCFLFYFFLKANALNIAPVYRIPLAAYYLVNSTQVLAYCLYFAFFRHFLNVVVTLPRLNTILRWVTGVLLAYVAIDFVLFFFPVTYIIRWVVWDSIRLALIGFCAVALVMIVKLRNKLMHYIFAGSIAMSVFGLAAMIFSSNYQLIENWPAPLNSPLLYFQLGITLELLCFSLGLGYKNRQDELEKIEATEALKFERERQVFERYKATVEAREAERRRIASEMHDDIGSGLTSILFLSNAIHRNAQNGQAEATEKIAGMASGLVDQMNSIIWSMNKEYDTLPDLLAYVRSHISELLDNADIGYQFKVQEPVPNLPLSSEQRRNLYLVVKEAVHNIIKHAHATKVTLSFRYADKLEIQIADNGVGLADATGRRFGNGLKNIRQRMQDIGGTVDFQSETGTGTTVKLMVDC